MTPVQFTQYRPGGTAPTIIAERITHWFGVDYNGDHGTTIVLDTGKEVTVREWPHEVEKKVSAALMAKGPA